MLVMPSPKRLILVSAPPAERRDTPIRRYRLARLPAVPPAGAGRFAHLKRTYD